MNADVTFLLSTHNRRQVLLETLGRLRQASDRSGLSAQIIVVDNASGDGTAAAVQRQFPEVHLIRTYTNRGPCSKNLGLPVVAAPYVVFLDDDSYPSAESLPRMIRHFEQNPKLGAAIFDVTLPDGSRECSAYPAVFIGCGTAFRADALREVGGLPEDFFMAAEEYDLSLRLLDAGWRIRRFDDLRVMHLKTPGSRSPTRITRLDVRNNLLLATRRFPRKWIFPFALDWVRRYRWIAARRGWRHRAAFWLGLMESVPATFFARKRRPISDEAFEAFAHVDEIERRMRRLLDECGWQSIVLVDVGKNILPFWLAAQKCGVRVAAVADPLLAKPGRRYRGAPVVSDHAAQMLAVDGAVIANVSPVHAAARREKWRRTAYVPVVDLFESPKRAIRVAA